MKHYIYYLYNFHPYTAGILLINHGDQRGFFNLNSYHKCLSQLFPIHIILVRETDDRQLSGFFYVYICVLVMT